MLRRRIRQRWYPALVGLAILVMVARIAGTFHVFSDTVDEAYHIGSGIALFEARKHIHGTQGPPLPRLVGALPLVLSGVEAKSLEGHTRIEADIDAFDIGHAVLTGGKPPYWSVLTRARAAMLVFPILVVVYVWLLGRYVGGRFVGCIAAIAVSTDPTVLGHGGLVTCDVAAAAGYLAGTYHGARLIGSPSLPRAIFAGLAIGAAIACKLSCIVVVLALLVLLILRMVRARFRVSARPKLSHLAAGALAAFVCLWAAYLFDVSRMDDSVALTETAEWDAMPAWLKHTPMPMPSLLTGFVRVYQHDKDGHRAYLNGEFSQRGWWMYFPEALALKSPAAIVIGLLVAVIGAVMVRRAPRRCVVLVPLLVFLVWSMSSGINIGVRHVLPVVPLLYLFVAHQLAVMKLRPLLIGIVAACAIETAWRHPDYLAFFNLAAGGPSGGDAYLLDSNLDWGQDHARLARWLDQNARGRLVSLRLTGHDRLRRWPHEGYQVLPVGSPPRGLLAISKNLLNGLYQPIGIDDGGQAVVEPVPPLLRHLQPMAKVGYSIVIYDLDQTIN